MDAPSRNASETLARTLEALLPEAWRRDPAVTVYPLGFSLQFSDADGRRHMLEARPVQPDAPALVSGAALAYSYTHVDTALDVDPILEQYRAVLTTIAAQESEVLVLLAAAAPAEAASPEAPPPGTDAPPAVAPPAPAELATILREALPAEWHRDLTVTSWPGGFEFGFVDADGRRHAFDVRRLSDATPSFVSGKALGYSYTMVDPSLDEAAVLEKYRTTLTALSAREADLLHWIDRPTVAPDDAGLNAEAPPAVAAGYPDQAPMTGTLAERVTALLPEEWRAQASVVSIKDGFAVELRDAAGGRHMLEARLLSAGFPSLVRGQRFGFSYLKVDPALDESKAVPRYREVLQGFVAHEEALAADLQT